MIAWWLIRLHVEFLLSRISGTEVCSPDERLLALFRDVFSESPYIIVGQVTVSCHRKLDVGRWNERLRPDRSVALADVSLRQNKSRKPLRVINGNFCQRTAIHAAKTRWTILFNDSGTSVKNGSEPYCFAVPKIAA